LYIIVKVAGINVKMSKTTGVADKKMGFMVYIA
jgi:hypothetical protein